jgi:hypothetical protein
MENPEAERHRLRIGREPVRQLERQTLKRIRERRIA